MANGWKVGLFLWSLAIIYSSVDCKGIFELRLLSYQNSNSKDVIGNCCGEESTGELSTTGLCSKACSTFFRVCLKEYQTDIDLNSKCTYGSRITDLIPERNSVDFSKNLGFEEPLQFPFSFGWPGYYSLILESYHNSTADSEGTLNQLLMRIAKNGNVLPGSEWTQETHQQASSALSFEYRVLCSPNHYGEQCSISCRPRDDSFGHFTCAPDGQKICLHGWQGRFCNEAVCAPGCDDKHGSCKKPHECVCEMGWIGPTCSECQKYPGCKHGSCKEKFECTCEEGWGGIFCNQDLNYCTHYRPCLNGATCTNTGQGHYTCSCQPGFTGTNCETKIQDCSMSPCLNGGFCKELETNYTCACPEGFNGRHCQINAKTCAENPCANGASCFDGLDGYQCVCAPGWTGGNCDIEEDECRSDPCLNGGRCVDRFDGYQCVCPVGFEGERCEKNINDCSETTCQNGGICVDDINNFRCECPAGFSGTLCQYNIDDCIKRPCANGGTCFDEVNGFSCMCRPGFRGKDCAIDINECTSNPCRNGGKCHDSVDDYSCECSSCFSGKNCETRHDDCRFANTFRPSFTPLTTPSYPIGTNSGQIDAGYYPGRNEQHAGTGPRSYSDTMLIIVVSVIVAFCAIVIALVVVVYCMYRRTKRNERNDLERQNERNQRLATKTQPDCINNKFVSAIPQTAIISPFQKIDNTERSASLKGRNLDSTKPNKDYAFQTMEIDYNPSTLADRNTLSEARPVCKAISVDKLNYCQKYQAAPIDPNQSIDTVQQKGFEGRGCISPTPQNPRGISSPVFCMKTEFSKDSGLGSPLSEDRPSCSSRLGSLASSESSSDLESARPLTVSVVSGADFLPGRQCAGGCSSPSERPGASSPLGHDAGRTLSPRRSRELIVCATGVGKQQKDSNLESGRSNLTGSQRPAEGFGPSRTLHQVHRHGPRPKPPPRQNSGVKIDEFATQV